MSNSTCSMTPLHSLSCRFLPGHRPQISIVFLALATAAVLFLVFFLTVRFSAATQSRRKLLAILKQRKAGVGRAWGRHARRRSQWKGKHGDPFRPAQRCPSQAQAILPPRDIWRHQETLLVVTPWGLGVCIGIY